jgi:streptomycin 3"-adenylyltransferase
MGGLKPDSDIDVFVVSRRATTAAQKQALVDGLLRISGRGNPSHAARSLELTVVVEGDIRPWRYPPRMDFLYGDWLRDELERGEIEEPRLNPDLATLMAMIRLASRPLFGPPADEVLPEVPAGDLQRAMLEGLDDLLAELETDTRNIVLTLARIWKTVSTGQLVSKDAAADWAVARLPQEHRPVLAHARAVYLGEEHERWDDLRGRIEVFAGHVVRQIRREAGR